jgi:hypothetical protein
MDLFEAWNEIEMKILAGERNSNLSINWDVRNGPVSGSGLGVSVGDVLGDETSGFRDGGAKGSDNSKGVVLDIGAGMECDAVLDVAGSKKAVWRQAVHLLETIFLSKQVLIQ